MKLGFVSAILPELTLEQVADFAAANGFDCVEVMCWPVGKAERRYAGVTHIDVTGFTATQADDVNAPGRSRRRRSAAWATTRTRWSPTAAEAKRLRRAHRRGDPRPRSCWACGMVNTFVGRDWTKTVDENWPRFLKTWKPLIAFAEDHGIKIGIENCPMSFTARRMARRQEPGHLARRSGGACSGHPQSRTSA